MKYLLVIAAAISAVYAQGKCVDLANAKFNGCAKGCVEAGATKQGCKAMDLSCMCGKMTQIQAEGTVPKCVLDCKADVGTLLSAAKEVCGCVQSGGKKARRGVLI